MKKGYTSSQGLIAQGRGECFDYLLGERTTPCAEAATKAAAALLLLAARPALSVNGNVAALVAEEMVALADALKIPLEVNLFHRTEERVKRIADLLREKGARDVLGEKPDASVPGLDHARALATRGGIYDSDVVLIPLDELSRHWSWMVRAAVAENPNTPTETLKRLAEDPDQSVQKATRNRAS